jgi:hypothetical protein
MNSDQKIIDSFKPKFEAPEIIEPARCDNIKYLNWNKNLYKLNVILNNNFSKLAIIDLDYT